MSRVIDMSIDNLEQFIEQKLLEILGDHDSGLQLKEEFRTKLEQRLKKSSKGIPREGVF